VVLDDDPATEVVAGEAAALVWAAAEGLNERDRAVLYLNTRQGLEGGDLAAALGLEHANPYSLLNRAKIQLERAIGALLIARVGRRDCASLAEMLGSWDGALTPLLRKRLGRHVDACASCQRTKARVLPLTAVGAAPVLRPRRAEAWPATMPDGDFYEIAARREIAPERWLPDGFPPPLDGERRRRRRGVAVLVAALGIAVLLTSAVAVSTAGGDDGERDTAPAAARALTGSPRSTTASRPSATAPASVTPVASPTTSVPVPVVPVPAESGPAPAPSRPIPSPSLPPTSSAAPLGALVPPVTPPKPAPTTTHAPSTTAPTSTTIRF
jgi:hypothetical protein